MRHQADLLEFLRRGGFVLVANARASRALERDFAAYQQEIGHRAWAAPKIATWQVWLDQLWQQHGFTNNESRLVLSHVQERTVWARIISRDPAARQVMSPDMLASLALEAYALLGEYRAHPYRNRWPASSSDDAAAFGVWADAFDRECRENHWLSRSHLAFELADHVANGTLTVTNEIRTLGFDRFTPAQQHFFVRSGRSFVSCDHFSPTNHCSLLPAQDAPSEMIACANWLRGRLLVHPEARLAVIVTDAQKIRAEFERVLLKVLMPRAMHFIAPSGGPASQYDTVTVTEPAMLPAFEFSLGVPLATVPVVRAALLLLRWLIAPLDQEEVSWLLLSGFQTDGEEEGALLGQVDAQLRALAVVTPEVDLGAFIKQRGCTRARADRFFQRLDSFASTALKSGIVQRSRSAMDWADEVAALLSLAGWPGSKTESSLRFQVHRKWEQLLTQLASLSFDGTRMRYREFQKTMEQLASETLFAPQSHNAPVQIIGALESSGQTFDAIWFMGADEEAWPAQGSPNPLIPLAIQRAVGMPHASEDHDWQLARTATDRIASSAPGCIFSYAKQNSAGDLRMSPLLARVVDGNIFEAAKKAIVTNTVSIERVAESGPILWPREKVAGGAAVLTSQSACAFQAFASRRLFAVDPECADWGLSALIRGDLMHRVLQSLWSGERGLVSSEGLKTAAAGHELEPLLDQKIAEIFRKHPATRDHEGWASAYLEVERARCKQLLKEWLDYELRRQPFVVEASEKEIVDLRVGDLKLRVRLDRVDSLPNGHKVLIDYKTGNVSASKWSCPRPEEPQLPLYATFGDLGKVSGLLFAQIRAGETQFKGHVKDRREIVTLGSKAKGGLEPLTDGEQQSWREELLRLANDFLRGDAAVAPKNYPKTCTYCRMEGLCRVAETEVPLYASEPDESEQAEGE